MEHMQVAPWRMATESQPGTGARPHHLHFRQNGTTITSCERVTETPWYVIRMPGVVGGGSPRELFLSRSDPEQRKRFLIQISVSCSRTDGGGANGPVAESYVPRSRVEAHVVPRRNTKMFRN